MTDEKQTLYCDGLDDALIGIEVNTGRAVYSVERIIDILVDQVSQDEMGIRDAWDYFNYNICDAYVGEMTPIYMSEHVTEWKGEDKTEH